MSKIIDKITISKYPPKDINVIWVDESQEIPVFKVYSNGIWKQVEINELTPEQLDAIKKDIDYTYVKNKPSINGITLSGNKTSTDLNLMSKVSNPISGKILYTDSTGQAICTSISYIGSFNQNELPELNGFEDAGALAFVKETRKYATWDGYGWTYMNGNPVTPRYLTFTANGNSSSVGFCCWSNSYEPVDMGKNMQYSTDGGVTWEDYPIGVGEDNLVTIQIDEGESVMFRGNNESLSYHSEDDNAYFFTKCYITGSIAASGDITSLLNNIGGDVPLAYSCFCCMFQDCSGLTQAPILPSTTLASFCYQSMFYGCTGLTQAPVLPATTLSISCYENMFSRCLSLTTASALPATTLASNCYSYMFYGCTSLTSAPDLPATTLADYCYNYMFSGCTSLTSAPALPATTLADYCYTHIFEDCTGITSHDVATLNDSKLIFANNSSCASLTIHATIPPTIANNTITGLPADCVIYVPAASVDAYKAAQYWSARASYIEAIQ